MFLLALLGALLVLPLRVILKCLLTETAVSADYEPRGGCLSEFHAGPFETQSGYRRIRRAYAVFADEFGNRSAISKIDVPNIPARQERG